MQLPSGECTGITTAKYMKKYFHTSAMCNQYNNHQAVLLAPHPPDVISAKIVYSSK